MWKEVQAALRQRRTGQQICILSKTFSPFLCPLIWEGSAKAMRISENIRFLCREVGRICYYYQKTV
jgi:hypothetical protein